MKATSVGGTAEFYQPGLQSVSGPATCLAIDGHRATIGVRNEVLGTDPPGGFIFVQDNGEGDAVDVVNVEVLDAAPTACRPPTEAQLDVIPQAPGLEHVYRGDIRVGVVYVASTP